MFGYSKEIFGCIITRIEDDIAHVQLNDKNGERSFMEIPREDFDRFNITFKEGNVFNFILKQFFEWEKIILKPVVVKRFTAEEIEAKRKYYEEKYGDV